MEKLETNSPYPAISQEFLEGGGGTNDVRMVDLLVEM